MWRTSLRLCSASMALLFALGCPSMWGKDHGLIHEAVRKDMNTQNADDVDAIMDIDDVDEINMRWQKVKCPPERPRKYIDCGATPCKVKCK